MKLELLTGSTHFWNRLKPEIETAKKRVYIQTLSCEGDAVGWDMARTMMASAATDKRIVIDHYTSHIINDRFIYMPGNIFDKELQAEVASTRKMVTELKGNGVAVTFVNPFGWLYCHIPRRNHKKIIVVDDDICYIGGINFSDHNFAWHDLMMRIENPQATEFLANDFLTSCEQKHFGGELQLDSVRLISFDGKNNPESFKPVVDLLQSARESIVVFSPYLSPPFTDFLGAASRRGVNVAIVSPGNNNKIQLKEYIQWAAQRFGFNLRLYRGEMSHLKAILVDKAHLILGSSNFDYFSYHFEQETIAIITDPDFIAGFQHAVIDVDVENCRPHTGGISRFRGNWRAFQINAVSKLMRLFNR
ncbi:MAG: phosphatidylserine/phosphatidylglycerophosphate/cardiolipin synthase family protein [Candidatus Zixiibacteriota bacterium]